MSAVVGVVLMTGLLTGCTGTDASTVPTEPGASGTALEQDRSSPVARVASPPDPARPGEPGCVRGWEGWWNATPTEGNQDGLPVRTVTVLTESGKVIDVHDRDRGPTVSLEDLGITDPMEKNPAWPANMAVVIDLDTAEVIEVIPTAGVAICGTS